MDLLISSNIDHGAIDKEGPGLMELTGVVQSTPITINAGSVIAGGPLTAGSAITIGSAGTLTVAGAGLYGEYYNLTPSNSGGSNPNFTSLAALNAHLAAYPFPSWAASSAAAGSNFDFLVTSNGGTTGPTNFPGPYNLGKSNFEVCYSGKINIPVAGSYTFSTTSEDGSMLWIDGQTAVNANQFQPWTTTAGTALSLTPGLHNIVVGFYHGTGDYGLHVDVTAAPSAAGLTLPARLPNSWLSLGDLQIGALSGSGNVLLQQGGLVINYIESSSTYSGTISGPGGLTVTNGTLVLRGTDSCSGGTTISGGTLQVGNGGSGEILTSPTVSLNNTAALVFNHADALTYSGLISGSGNLTQTGTGTLTLTGSNNYSGGTTISQGTLQVTSGGNLSPAGGFTLATSAAVLVTGGGQLNLNGGSLSLANNASVNVATGGQLYAGPVTLGNGTLTAANSGAINLAGLTCSGSASAAAVFSSSSPITLGSLQIAYTSATMPSNMVMVQSGAQVAVSGPVGVGSAGPNPISGSLTIDGSGTQLVQTANQPVTIGMVAAGPALLTVSNGATLVASGPVYVNPSGTLQTSGGVLTANGDITVTGGKLLAGGAFSLGSGHALTVQTGGLADFAQGPLFLDQGTAAHVASGGTLQNVSQLAVAFSGLGNGALSVDGSNTVVAAGTSWWAAAGRAARRPSAATARAPSTTWPSPPIPSPARAAR